MRLKEVITESAKLWGAKVRVDQANYVGYVDAQVWASNAQQARTILKQQFNIQDHHVGSVKEIKMKAKEFIKEASYVSEAVDESWVQAYQALEANGGEPTPEKPTLFIKQMAMLAKDAGIDQFRLLDFVKQYFPDDRTMKPNNIARLVQSAMANAPGIDQIRLYTQQQQAQAQQFTQQQSIGALQHDLSVQQLVRQNQLDAADTEAMLAMDLEARQAIKERQQQMALEANERLAKIEMDIRASKEPEAERAQALEIAKMNNAHELQVIQVTAEGEYKKAKLEADYQIKIKELENIDNAGERQNKLDIINANKAKELALIDADTKSKIQKLQAETNAERAQSNIRVNELQAESDIRVQEAFMTTFKPIWGSLIQSASQLGRTLGQSISAVTGALNRLSKPVMPQAQKPANEDINRLRQLAGR
jgi:hypothetical protein